MFGYTGSSQTFIVPNGVTSLTITASGAQGGAAGGVTTAKIPVTPGATLDVEVGGQPGSSGAGGYNGGGAGGGSGSTAGQGGGGASDVRIGGTSLNDRVIVAGGGGGSSVSGQNFLGSIGGLGGGLIGQSVPSGAATGGTQSAGGAGGGPCGTAAVAGASGSFGVGGAGGNGIANGSGGGGGWYGGGGGGGWGLTINAGPCTTEPPGAGAGGSSYAEPSATNVTMMQGGNYGNGSVFIFW